MDSLSPRYVAATAVAAGLAIVGAWLPWAGTVGDPVVTGVPGAAFGLAGTIPSVVLPAVVAAVVVLASSDRGWHPEWVLVPAGLTIVAAGVDRFALYRSFAGWEAQPGLYLTVASGLALVVIGVGGWLRRRRSGIDAEAPSTA